MKRTKREQKIHDEKVKSNWEKIRRINRILKKVQQVIDRFKEANPSLMEKILSNFTKRKGGY